MKNLNGLLSEVEQLYARLDTEVQDHTETLMLDCNACGACCNFASYDHRLFLTPPEILYFAHRLQTVDLRTMVHGVCPYMKEGQCTAYAARFSSCRIFGCRRDEDLQSQWSEQTLEQLKGLCGRHELEYTYSDLATALNTWGAELVVRAGEPHSADHVD